MADVLVIRNWPETFEPADCRKLKGPLKWVGIPTKHDGTGYRTVLLEKNAAEILGAWWTMVQVAAKMPMRGVLANENGPFDAERLAIKTGLPAKIFKSAINLLTNHRINWIHVVDWAENVPFADFSDDLRGSLQISTDLRRSPKSSGEGASTTPHEGNGQNPHNSPAISENPHKSVEISGDPHKSPPVLHNTTLQDTTYTTRPGASEPPVDPISDPETARQVISEFVFRDPKPGAWSHQAMEGLVHHLPIRRKDVLLVGWLHKLPADDSVQELKVRRQSPGTLMQNWSDEVIRARRFREKIGAGASGESGAKKEPARWREFYRWKYGADCVLPESFWKLPADQRAEYERDFAGFEKGEGAVK